MSATQRSEVLPSFGAGANADVGPMLWALAGAALLHALLLLGIGFEMSEPRQIDRGSIEMMLITATAPTPLKPDPESIKAQADREGDTLVPLPELSEPQTDSFIQDEGLSPDELPPIESEAPSPPAPLPEPEPLPAPEPEPQPEPEPEPEPEPPDLLSAEDSALALATMPSVSAADILSSRNAEIARLTARISAQTHAYQSRTRRKAISTSTREFRYATYMEAWRRKVERVGNLNYPQEAREQGLYGNLILHVAVRADGSLEGVRVVRSSGQELLDQAAVRIVELAAPFAEFPPDIAAETDVLDITRTWQFQRNHQLGWDN
ncbi:MAG: energy transducer TonB [Thiohalocapsa sp.]